MSAQFTTPPFRSLDDFVSRNGRFELPDFQDLDKWTSKALGNMIFFQTNYFIMLAVIFLPFMIFYTSDFTICVLASGAIVGLFKFLATAQPTFASVTRGHPFLYTIVMFSGGYLIVLYASSVAIYLGCFIVPVAFIFLHASLRSRPIRGKSITATEKLSAMRTPMGVLLELLGETFEQLGAFN